eukprot:gene13644-19526_t
MLINRSALSRASVRTRARDVANCWRPRSLICHGYLKDPMALMSMAEDDLRDLIGTRKKDKEELERVLEWFVEKKEVGGEKFKDTIRTLFNQGDVNGMFHVLSCMEHVERKQQGEPIQDMPNKAQVAEIKLKRERLHSLFESFDHNNDGLINVEELRAGFDHLGIHLDDDDMQGICMSLGLDTELPPSLMLDDFMTVFEECERQKLIGGNLHLL